MKIILLSLFLLVSSLFANIGKITALSGDITLQRETQTLKPTIGFIVNEKDKIATGNNARLQLVFNDKTIISLGKNSTFDVEEYFFDEQKPDQTKASFKVAKGIFKSITGRIGKINPNQFKLKTKSASIGIRGTIFFGAVQPGKPDSIACTQGAIVVETTQGIVEVPAGQFTTVEVGQAPTPPAAIPPAQAQQLEQSSGADENQKESGEGTGTAPAATTNEPAKEEQKNKPAEQKEEQPAEQKEQTTQQQDNQQNDNAVTTDDNQPVVAINEDTTPPPATPIIDEIAAPTEVVKDATDTANDTKNDVAVEKDNKPIVNVISGTDPIDEPTPDSTPDPTTDPTTPDPITTTYDTWHSSVFAPKNSLILNPAVDNLQSFHQKLQFDATGEPISSSFTATDGVLNGSSTIYSWYMDGSTIEEGNAYNIPTITTATIDNLTLTNPYTSYIGFTQVYNTTSGMTNPLGNEVDLYEDVYSDSLQEFIIKKYGFYDSLVNYEFEGTLLLGIKTDFAALPDDGISYYIEPEYFNDAISGYYDTFTSYTPTMVNWKNKNLLTYEIYNNRVFIGMGLISQETESTKAKVDFTMYESLLDYTQSQHTTSSDIQIFGSEYQGWGGTVTVTDSVGDTAQYTHGEYRIPFSAFTSTATTDYTFENPEETITPTGTTTFTGFATGGYDGSNNLEIILDRTSGITGSIYTYDGEVTFGGAFGTHSAYITDDTFATLGFGMYDTSSQITVDDGWLIAIDSGSIAVDGTDDGISWGLWGMDTSYAENDIAMEAWVAGQNLVSDISSMMMSDVVSYTGQAMGILINNDNLSTFIDPSISTMDLTFDFGTGDITANLNANGTTIVNSMILTSDIISNTSSIYSASGYDQPSELSGQIKGSFYNGGATTAGSFEFSNPGGTAKGVYKATQDTTAIVAP